MPPDAPVAAETPAADSGADFGLSAEEKTAYDQMRAEPAPTGDPGHVEPDAPPAAEPAPGAEPPPAAPGAPPAAPAAGTPAAPAPAAAAGDDDDEPDPAAATLPDGSKPPKRVSYNKYRRVEDEAKKNAAELAEERKKSTELSERQARLDERLKLINEALQQPAAAAAPAADDDPEPDPEKDIFGHNAWLRRRLEKTEQTLTERLNGIESERKAVTEEQQVATTYLDDAGRLAATEPNFLPAYQHLMHVRTAQLANYFFGKDLTDPNEKPLTVQELAKIKAEVSREERQLVSQAIKAGKSPAGAVYAMARMSGYRPAAPGTAPAAAGAPAGTNGAQAPAAPGTPSVAAAVAAAAPAAPGNGAAPAKPTVLEEINKIKTGQDAALSLSAGGGAPAPVLSPAKLADMPQEEFGALLDNISRDQLRRLMGG